MNLFCVTSIEFTPRAVLANHILASLQFLCFLKRVISRLELMTSFPLVIYRTSAVFFRTFDPFYVADFGHFSGLRLETDSVLVDLSFIPNVPTHKEKRQVVKASWIITIGVPNHFFPILCQCISLSSSFLLSISVLRL